MAVSKTNKPKTARPGVWIGIGIAAAVVIVLIIAVPSMTANGGTFPGTTDNRGVPAGNYMTQNASVTFLNENWDSVPSQINYNPWFQYEPFKVKETMPSPVNTTYFAVGTNAMTILNNPDWKDKGLDFGVALVFVNSNYKGQTGTVVFVPGPNIWSTSLPYIVLADFENFNVTAAKLYYEVKFV